VKTFEITIHDAVETTPYRRVDLSGFLDAHTVREFDSRMNQLVSTGTSSIVLGLQSLNYISSAGVASLMGLMQRLRGQQGNLVILSPSDKVFHVLKTLGFTSIFQIVGDEKEILGSGG
jgi:anti-anti-sigma factor